MKIYPLLALLILALVRMESVAHAADLASKLAIECRYNRSHTLSLSMVYDPKVEKIDKKAKWPRVFYKGFMRKNYDRDAKSLMGVFWRPTSGIRSDLYTFDIDTSMDTEFGLQQVKLKLTCADKTVACETALTALGCKNLEGYLIGDQGQTLNKLVCSAKLD